MRNCDKCGAELVPVFADRMRRRNDYPQYENTLVVELGGGYGMLIDPMDLKAPEKFVLCKDCGTQFFKDNSWAVTEETEHLVEEDESVQVS